LFTLGTEESANITTNPARFCANFAHHLAQVVTSACVGSRAESRTGVLASIHRDSGATCCRIGESAETHAAVASAVGTFNRSAASRKFDRAVEFFTRPRRSYCGAHSMAIGKRHRGSAAVFAKSKYSPAPQNVRPDPGGVYLSPGTKVDSELEDVNWCSSNCLSMVSRVFSNFAMASSMYC